MSRTAATIATRTHLGLAHCLATSFLEHHPDGEVVVLLVDGSEPEEVFADLAVTTITTDDLDAPDLDAMRARYSTFELCNALKPFLLQHVLDRPGTEQALYLDSDLYVVDSLVDDVYAVLEGAAIFATPHLCDISEAVPGGVARDLAVLLRGTLNGGCIGVRRSTDAARFLSWWADRLTTAGYYRLEQGMNCDQRWLDLVLGYDLDLVVSRHRGLNLAYWNLDERAISSRDGCWFSNDEPLRFVHFSGFSADDPTALTRSWSRYDLVNRPDVAPLAEEYRAALRASLAHVERARTRPAPVGPRRATIGRSDVIDRAPVDATTSPADVAVVIPVHDAAATLAAAVHSALAQEGVAVEVVVVDDGSHDHPAAVLPDDPRVTLLTTGHGGVSRARNRGWSATSARMVIFLDADDTISDPHRARDQLALLDEWPEMAIVHSGWEVVAHGEPVATRTPWTQLPTLELERWIDYPVLLPSAMAFRREHVRAVGGFDEALRQAEDLDLVLRLLLQGWTATWLERVTTRYHRHATSASTDVDAQVQAMAVVLDRLFSDPALPGCVAARQRPVRYNTHVWLASRYHRAGRPAEMAAHLAASSVWSDAPVGSLALDWVDRFVTARADAGDPPLDVAALTADPAWRSLVRSAPRALLERGVAVGGHVTVRRPVVPAPPLASGMWTAAVALANLPAPALDLSSALARSYGRHRSGWAFALDALRPLQVDGGVLVDGFVEHTFHRAQQPAHAAPWIGFLHNPAELPPWYPIDQSAAWLLADERFRESLATCRGLFTLSTALRDWWAARVDVPVEAVAHPTSPPLVRFSPEGFLQNPFPRVVQVGTWLRKLHAVHVLPVRRLQRTIVHQHEPYIEALFAAEREALRLRVDESIVETLPFLDDRAYDELLSCNLVFVDLYAASANNAVGECLARATPILVNPLPAVREYLGDDYPLYFSSRTEAAGKAEDATLVVAAHEYLAARPQAEQLHAACFLGAVARSEIYRGLTG